MKPVPRTGHWAEAEEGRSAGGNGACCAAADSAATADTESRERDGPRMVRGSPTEANDALRPEKKAKGEAVEGEKRRVRKRKRLGGSERKKEIYNLSII